MDPNYSSILDLDIEQVINIKFLYLKIILKFK